MACEQLGDGGRYHVKCGNAEPQRCQTTIRQDEDNFAAAQGNGEGAEGNHGGPYNKGHSRPMTIDEYAGQRREYRHDDK